MKYVLVELQTMEGGAVANIVTAYDAENTAKSAYHSVMAAAAVSALPVHSAVLMDNYGRIIMSGSYPDAPQEEA